MLKLLVRSVWILGLVILGVETLIVVFHSKKQDRAEGVEQLIGRIEFELQTDTDNSEHEIIYSVIRREEFGLTGQEWEHLLSQQPFLGDRVAKAAFEHYQRRVSGNLGKFSEPSGTS